MPETPTPPTLPTPARLGEAEIAKRLAALPAWRREGEAIHAAFRFTDFVQAFGFMSKVALRAEAMHHHPDWSNVWSRVSIRLTTHEAGGLTALDFELAARIDALL